MRAVLATVLLLAAALAWGYGGHAVDGLRGGAWASALGAPWLVLAFAIGAALAPRALPQDAECRESGLYDRLGDSQRARTWFVAPAAGAAVLAAAVAVYYAALVDDSPRYAVLVGVAWSAVAAPAGAFCAAAGAAWRRGSAAAGALPPALLAGEALLLLGEWQHPGARAVLIAELAAAAVLLFVMALRTGARLRTLALAAVLVVACAATEDVVRDALRGVGWAGA